MPAVRSLLKRGGFNLTKWGSNTREVLASIPEDDQAPSMQNRDLSDKLPFERALGMQWNMEEDMFMYKINPKNKPKTRRGILSVTSSLYDPLGLVAPVTITPKIIQQYLCRLEKLGWDDAVPDDIGERWDRWLAQLPLLMQLNVARCFKPQGLLEEFTVELHHFCDASEMAYGAASYVKVYDANGTTRVSLVMGKARVAPIQPLTIPRLELSSAVTAVRLHEIITAEPTIGPTVHQCRLAQRHPSLAFPGDTNPAE